MDLKKIFLKDACPTSIGGQALLEGIVMRGPKKNAIAIRLPDGKIHMKVTERRKMGKWTKWPILRGVVSFVISLVDGTKDLMYSADIVEQYWDEADQQEPGKFEKWFEKTFGAKALWNFLVYVSVIISLAVSIGVFVLLPTAIIGWIDGIITSGFALNIIEGFFRLALFILYVWAIAGVKDIKTVYQYHGAEHKTIHCLEKNLELTPDNAQSFYTLHPRCGTSFLMFVMVIAILLFSCFGWPSLLWRILSRLALIPVVAGLSYELLKWAGRSDNVVVRILSMPGLWLQKITTAEPDKDQLEVAICALKAVLPDNEDPCFEGFCDLNGKEIPDESTN
ncbi:MAG: DUF1385 domain-containing protein [Clostridia bacterium]|nr:DUF1385 domain-containing protein [Clostridia bacterium]